jgi:hypothetical protein
MSIGPDQVVENNVNRLIWSIKLKYKRWETRLQGFDYSYLPSAWVYREYRGEGMDQLTAHRHVSRRTVLPIVEGQRG